MHHGFHEWVGYELPETMGNAIRREKAIKEWKKKRKLEFIERENPNRIDLYDQLG